MLEPAIEEERHTKGIDYDKIVDVVENVAAEERRSLRKTTPIDHPEEDLGNLGHRRTLVRQAKGSAKGGTSTGNSSKGPKKIVCAKAKSTKQPSAIIVVPKRSKAPKSVCAVLTPSSAAPTETTDWPTGEPMNVPSDEPTSEPTAVPSATLEIHLPLLDRMSSCHYLQRCCR